MVDRSELWLGRHVVVRLCGGETVGAVVDGLCNDWVGVRLDRGGYVIADWEDIEVDRTEKGEVLAEKESEKPREGLEEEIVRFFSKNPIPYGHLTDWPLLKNTAIHFYDLGCRRTAEKYDEIEYNRQRASGSSEIPKDLEAYAQRVEDYYDVGEERGYLCTHRGDIKDAVIAGAKWQAEQDQETIELAEDHAYLAGAVNEREKMMKEALEGEVCIPNVWVEHKEGKELVVRAEISKEGGFKFGDKVRVIVCKKED